MRYDLANRSDHAITVPAHRYDGGVESHPIGAIQRYLDTESLIPKFAAYQQPSPVGGGFRYAEGGEEVYAPQGDVVLEPGRAISLSSHGYDDLPPGRYYFRVEYLRLPLHQTLQAAAAEFTVKPRPNGGAR